VLDKRFEARIGNAAIERIATGFRWAEGPAYFRDGGYLLWSDIPNNRIMRWLARLHQLDAIFTIFGASDRDKRLILQGRGLRKRL
jgi:gluconolactonase